MLQWASERGIPSMVDVKDQWPAVFVEAFPRVLQPLARLAFAPYFWLGRRALKSATAFCSMSDPFVEWMCQFSGRSRRSTDVVTPLSSPRGAISDEARAAALRWWCERGVDLAHDRRVAFVGSLSSAFDFTVVANLAKRCLANQLDVQFVICGSGDQSETVARIMAGLPNVILPGWIDLQKSDALMSGSRAIIAPYRTNDAFSRSVPNKIVDGFATGRPILTTLLGLTADTLKKFEAGLGSRSESDIYAELSRLMCDDDYYKVVSKHSGELYENHFKFEKVYGDLVESLCQLAYSHSSVKTQ
jgi:glycosyltransferase involved in cell wall biosynthesis